MPRSRSGLALLTGLIASTTAARADWRYCYAAAPDQHRFYVSLPFVETLPMAAIEDAFTRMLDERRIERRAAACPRGHTEEDVRDLIAHATSYNRQNGNTVVPLDWSPPNLTALPTRRWTW